MKKEKFALVLYIISALMCASCSIFVDDAFVRGVYAICSVGVGMLSGMTLQEIISKDN